MPVPLPPPNADFGVRIEPGSGLLWRQGGGRTGVLPDFLLQALQFVRLFLKFEQRFEFAAESVEIQSGNRSSTTDGHG